MIKSKKNIKRFWWEYLDKKNIKRFRWEYLDKK